MSAITKLRNWLGSQPLIYRFYRYITGECGPRWHVIIRFNARNKSWSCQSYPGWQSRNNSTIHLMTSALEEVRPELKKSFKLVAWLGDMPPEWLLHGPHLAYAKGDDQLKTTLIPDFAFWGWPEAGMPDYDDVARQMLEASKSPPLHKGIFWIGAADKHATRKILFDIGKVDERVIAHTVEWIGDKSDAQAKLLPTKGNNYVTLPDHCQYQYLIDLQGGGYSARLKLLMFSGRPLFIQERRWREYFFDQMQPFKHFIPVSEDLSDLSAKLDWADSHPQEAAEIAANAQKFALENLMRCHAIAEFKRLFRNCGGLTPHS